MERTIMFNPALNLEHRRVSGKGVPLYQKFCPVLEIYRLWASDRDQTFGKSRAFENLFLFPK
jgi:hypothetical protein